MQRSDLPSRTSLTLLLLAVVACSTEGGRDGGQGAATRPARPSLLGDAGTLAGHALELEGEGPWRVRKTAGGGASWGEMGAPATERAVLSTRMVRDEVLYEALAVADGPADGAGSDRLDAGVSPKADPDLAGEGPPATGVVQAPLRAGSTDDNADYEAYCAFLREQYPLWPGACQDLDLTDRRTVTVRDRNGRPVPGARVAVVDERLDQIVWRGTTYGDGSFYLFPGLLPQGTADTFLVEVSIGGEVHRDHWDRKGAAAIDLPGYAFDGGELALDVLFLIDTTGSMSDEIERIKESLLGVTARLRAADREFDLRYGAVLYRDITDDYVTKCHPFTDDIEAFDAALRGVAAGGGGDSPESLNQGLAVAIDGVEWRPGAAKLVFLVADAAPHMDYENDIAYGESARAAIAEGIKIHAVAASGLSGAGTVVFRQVAQMTGGKFVFIEYGGDVQASAAGHGVAGEVKSNNLDDILFEQIQAEIDGWARRAAD